MNRRSLLGGIFAAAFAPAFVGSSKVLMPVKAVALPAPFMVDLDLFAGLQPHLEAFMWEVLRTIQTRVNEDGLKLLLGPIP